MTAEEQSPLHLRQDSVWLSRPCADQGRGCVHSGDEGKLKYHCDNFAECDNRKRSRFPSWSGGYRKSCACCCVVCVLPFFEPMMTFDVVEAQMEDVDHTATNASLSEQNMHIAAEPPQCFHFLSECASWFHEGKCCRSRYTYILPNYMAVTQSV